MKHDILGFMSDKRRIVSNLTGFVLLTIAFVIGILVFMQIFSGDIWYDEVFSVRFAEEGWGNIIDYTIRDVHPPLYYFYLKICCYVFGFLGEVVAGKVASVIPMFVMLLIAVTFIRKRYGVLEMGIYALLVTVMPQMAVYYTEIRMYSFALVLLTVAGIMLADIVSEEYSRPWKWGMFYVFCLFAAYTQYFAAVAAGGLYILLLLYYIFPANRDSRKLWGAVGMMIGSIIGYVPWLPAFFKQLKTVGGSYWIQPMTLRSIPGCMKFIFLPVSGDGNITYVAAGLMIIVCGWLYLTFFLEKEKPSGKDYIAVFEGIAALSLVVGVGYVATFLNSPIFTYRYMIPALGLIYLGIVVALSKKRRTYLYVMVIIAVLFTGCFSVKGFYYEEQKKICEFENAQNNLSSLRDGSVVISNFDHVVTISSYYLPNLYIYQYEGEPDKLVCDLFGNYRNMVGDEEVRELTEKNDDVFFFGSFTSRDEIVEKWNSCGITAEYEGECLVERYWFNIYRLRLSDE